MAFAALEPFGPLRDDLRAGTAASAAANAWGGRTRPEHFFDTLRPPRPDRVGGVSRLRAALGPALTPLRRR